jgi:hypothetical protein
MKRAHKACAKKEKCPANRRAKVLQKRPMFKKGRRVSGENRHPAALGERAAGATV